jgi:hypothetical protein
MSEIHEGQCGLCMHFGEDHRQAPQLVAIQSTHQASETLVDECSHPKLAPLHLMVTPLSGCNGFERIAA